MSMRRGCGPGRSTESPSPSEIGLPVAHVARRTGHSTDVGKRCWVQHHRSRKAQAPRLAGGTKSQILDGFEIEIVRKPKDAADDLGRREADGITEYPVHVGLPFGFQASLPGRPCEEHRGISVAIRARPPEGKEF